MAEVNEMDVETGGELIIKAYQEKEKEKAWQVYLTVYPKMTEETFVSFDDWMEEMISRKESNESVEEILVGVKDILDSYQAGRR